MRIFIDESGSFAVPRNGSDGFCCVGGLVIADAEWDNAAARFAQFKRAYAPDTDEIKGSRMGEDAMRHVLTLLNEVDAKLFVEATAGSFFSDAAINEFKDQQAYWLGKNITERHTEPLRRQMAELQSLMRAMAPQEYLQLYLLTRLIERILRVVPNHFGFFAPRELGAFHWAVDGKNEGRSAFENCWNMIGGGLLQAAFLAEPSKWIPSIDTTAFDAAFLSADQSWPSHIPPRKTPGRGQLIDLAKILRESFRFADSRADDGLQLADIATNAFRRVVRGNLSREIAPLVGSLLIGFNGPSIELHSLYPSVPSADVRLAGTQEEILMELEQQSWRIGQSRWVNRYFRRQLRGGSLAS